MWIRPWTCHSWGQSNPNEGRRRLTEGNLDSPGLRMATAFRATATTWEWYQQLGRIERVLAAVAFVQSANRPTCHPTVDIRRGHHNNGIGLARARATAWVDFWQGRAGQERSYPFCGSLDRATRCCAQYASTVYYHLRVFRTREWFTLSPTCTCTYLVCGMEGNHDHLPVPR